MLSHVTASYRRTLNVDDLNRTSSTANGVALFKRPSRRRSPTSRGSRTKAHCWRCSMARVVTMQRVARTSSPCAPPRDSSITSTIVDSIRRWPLVSQRRRRRQRARRSPTALRSLLSQLLLPRRRQLLIQRQPRKFQPTGFGAFLCKVVSKKLFSNELSFVSTRWLGERDLNPMMRELIALIYASGDERQQVNVNMMQN